MDWAFQGVGVYAVNVWVLQRRNIGCTPERVRWDLIQLFDDVLFREMFGPSSDVKYEVLTGWFERDEPEDKLLRNELLVAMYTRRRGCLNHGSLRTHSLGVTSWKR